MNKILTNTSQINVGDTNIIAIIDVVTVWTDRQTATGKRCVYTNGNFRDNNREHIKYDFKNTTNSLI